jgi:LmbE family N-acetylglucosaminyl deacetylase
VTGLATPARALAIVAHCDDAELTSGGTLAKWAAAGCEVSILVCTDGSKGSWDPAQDTAELVATRQAEQRAALAALGSTGECVFLGQVDGELDPGLPQRALVCEAIRRLRPDVVLGHDPWKRYRIHPDHRAAGFLAAEGIVAARDPHFFPEQLGRGDDGLRWHRPSALLLFEADEPDHDEDVAGFEERKIAALLEHRSQFRSTHGIDDADDAEQRAAFGARTRALLGDPPRERFKAVLDL